MRTKKIKIPIYDYRLTLIEADNSREMEEYFHKTKLKFVQSELYAHAIDHLRIENGERWLYVYLVFNRKNKWMKMSHSAIAHECNHITNYIYDNIGAEHYADEPHCYLLQWLVKTTNEFLGIKDDIK